MQKNFEFKIFKPQKKMFQGALKIFRLSKITQTNLKL